MKIIISIVLLILIAIQSIAQNQLLIQATEMNDRMNVEQGYTKESVIEGSPYQDDNASNGIFFLKNKSVVETPTKLNSYYNTFEYVANGKTYLIDGNTVDSVKIKNETYMFIPFKSDGKSMLKAVKIIDNHGDNGLYVYQGVEFKPEVRPAGYVDPKPARFEWIAPLYIIKIKDKIIVLNSFKELIALFPGKEAEIKKYIKGNGISINKVAKLEAFFKYVSQLQ